MNDNNDKRDLQKLRASSFFDKETSPKVEKTIDELLEELNQELAELRKTIEENDRFILENMSYEELIRAIELVRLGL